MEILIKIVHVIACFFLMIVVLLQAGKGGGMGIAFGSAGAQQVFGGRGAGNFLEKLTAAFAGLFMLTSISLAYMASATESTRLHERAAERAKKEEERKKKDADLNKKVDEAKKAGEAASSSSSSTPAESPSAPAPAAPAGGTAAPTPAPTGTAPAAPTTTPANPSQAPPH